MRQSRVGYCNVVSRSVDGPVDVDGPASSSDKVRGFKMFGGGETNPDFRPRRHGSMQDLCAFACIPAPPNSGGVPKAADFPPLAGKDSPFGLIH